MSAASAASSAAPSSKRASAPTASPAASSTTSPGTRSRAATIAPAAIAQHAGTQGGEFAQRLHRTFGPALLPDAEERIREHDDEDHAGVTCLADGNGNARGDEQDVDKRAGELADENGDPRTAFGFREGIRAVCSEATLYFLRRDAVRGASKPREHGFVRQRVPLGPGIRVPGRCGFRRVVGLRHGRSTRPEEPDRSARRFVEITAWGASAPLQCWPCVPFCHTHLRLRLAQ